MSERNHEYIPLSLALDFDEWEKQVAPMKKVTDARVSVTDMDLFGDILTLLRDIHKMTECEWTRQYIEDELDRLLSEHYDVDRLLDRSEG